VYNYNAFEIKSEMLCHFQQYFSCIVAVSFIGGGNRKCQEKTTDLPQVTSCVQGFIISETETDHWLQLVTFGSYQSPKATICSIYLQRNLKRILVIHGSKFADGNHL
jgi:hypothetical protein